MGKYSFQIIPPHSGKIRQIRIEGSRLRWILFAVGALILVNVLFFGFNLFNFNELVQSRAQSNNNKLLAQNIKIMEHRADSLEILFGNLREINSKVREVADLPPIDESNFSYGIGGPELAYLDPDQPIILARAKEIDRKLDSLIVAAQTENKAILETQEHFTKRKSLFDRTPSIWPMKGYVSSGFGKRLDPFTGIWKQHEGIDICARKGTPVRATADGKVRFTGWYHGYGKMVRVNHTYYETRYAHLSEIKVRPGQSVKRGDIIGTCGNSGNTTGVHLHYEVRISGKATDPKKYISPAVVED